MVVVVVVVAAVLLAVVVDVVTSSVVVVVRSMALKDISIASYPRTNTSYRILEGYI